MTPITKTFQFHVDARLFAFRWIDAQYIDVEYCATQHEDRTVTCITKISAPPYLLSMIIVHNNWMTLMKEIENAAKANAEKYFAGSLLPVLEQVFAPFTKHI